MSPAATKSAQEVPVVVGVADGGIALNWSQVSLEKEDFKSLLHAVLSAAGFEMPEMVTFERNKTGADGKPRVDYYRLRVPSDECQMNRVDPNVAVINIRRYLESPAPTERFGLKFILRRE